MNNQMEPLIPRELKPSTPASTRTGVNKGQNEAMTNGLVAIDDMKIPLVKVKQAHSLGVITMLMNAAVTDIHFTNQALPIENRNGDARVPCGSGTLCNAPIFLLLVNRERHYNKTKT